MGKDELRNEQLRTFIVIFGVLIVIGLVLLARFFFEGIIYAFFAFTGTVVLFSFKSIAKVFGVKIDPSIKLLGISNRWILGSFVGLMAGIGFLLLTQVKIFGAVITMAIPQVPLALNGQAIVVIVLAPICETIFFTTAILSILSLFMPLWVAIPIKAVIFSVYHYWAYVVMANNTLESVIGSFIGAGLFGILGSLLAYYRGAEADITAHGFFNGWNFNQVYHLFSVTN